MIQHRLKEEAFEAKRTGKKKARSRTRLECVRQSKETGESEGEGGRSRGPEVFRTFLNCGKIYITKFTI